MFTAIIRAELSGSDRCTALGIVVQAFAPILEICRRLIAAGHDPATPLEAYRGDMLCLKVRGIGEAAGFEINARGTGLIPFRAVRTAPPVAPIEKAATPVPELPIFDGKTFAGTIIRGDGRFVARDARGRELAPYRGISTNQQRD